MIKKLLPVSFTLFIIAMNTGSTPPAKQKVDIKIVPINETSNAKKDAQNDIEKAQFKYYVIGQPMAHDSIWQTILKSDYGIELITLGCTPAPEETKYTEEYNEVMIPFLKKNFGESILSISEAKARKEVEKTSSQIPPKEKITTQSKKLDKKIIESWRRQKDFFIENNFEIIDWEEAKGILLKNEIRGGKQYHTGWLTIYTTDDRKYLVKQPKMDALWEFMEEKNLKLEGFGTE